uniref:hypothetical protein n=1 Tax=Phascolarctobacterium succinatutens TaxID=626940 RepID=UPI003AB4052B
RFDRMGAFAYSEEGEFFWVPPPLNVSGKGKNQNQFLRKPREITNASAAKQPIRTHAKQKQKRGRPAA